jgi:hypothetical protein
MILLASNDGDVLRTVQEPGFSQWFVYLLVFLMIADRFKSYFTKDKTEVSGSVETRGEKVYAEKSTTDKSIASLTTKIDALRIDSQRMHTDDKEAARQRLETLKDSIHAEMQRLSENGRSHIETCFKDAYQRINEQGERIAALEAANAAALAWRS